MTKQTILITGSKGKIGSALLTGLKDKGYSLRALSYDGTLKSENHDIDSFKGDLLSPESYVSALKGVSTVIHAAGITHTNNIDRYYRINSFATLQLLKLCKIHGVKRFIFFSTRAISSKGGHYRRSKRIAEKYVQESGLNWVILRFGEIYGTGSSKGIDGLLSHIDHLPIVPIVGNGEYTLMPLYIRDAVSSVMKVLENEDLNSRIYTISGPEVMSYNELVNRILAAKMVKKKIIHIPINAFRALSTIIAFVTADAFLIKDQLPRLICEKSNDISLARKELDFSPARMEDTPLFSLHDIRPCTVCGKTAFLQDKRLRLYNCPNCTHVFTSVTGIDSNIYSEKYFRERHKNWFNNPDFALFRFFHKVLRVYLNQEKPILLDVGCGKGDLLNYLQQSDPEIELFGIDLAENISPSFHFIRGDFLKEELPLKFHAICANALIEHVDNPIFLINKIRNILLPGGILLMSTINSRSLIYRIARILNIFSLSSAYDQVYGEHHLQHYTNHSLKYLLEKNGFKVIIQNNRNYPLKAVDVQVTNLWIKRLYLLAVGVIFALQALTRTGITQVLVCKKDEKRELA